MKIKLICPHCYTDQVRADASAEWDVEKQEWVLVTEFDNRYCDNCGEDDITPIEEPIVT